MSDIQSAVPYIAFTIIVGVFLWGQQRKFEKALGMRRTTEHEEKIPEFRADSYYHHLAIHYLRAKGVPDTPDSAPLKYITVGRSAYRLRELPDFLVCPIKEHRIIWYPYDDEKVLERTLLAAKYTIYDDAPSEPETLGLSFVDGKWIAYEPHSDILSRLEGHRLDDLQVFNLTRRNAYALFRSKVRRTLLVKFPENQQPQAWLAPAWFFELTEKRIIAEEDKGMRFYESCKRWCERYHYNTDNLDRRYPDSALLVEGT
jgi:hypothetical protein